MSLYSVPVTLSPVRITGSVSLHNTAITVLVHRLTQVGLSLNTHSEFSIQLHVSYYESRAYPKAINGHTKYMVCNRLWEYSHLDKA